MAFRLFRHPATILSTLVMAGVAVACANGDEATTDDGEETIPTRNGSDSGTSGSSGSLTSASSSSSSSSSGSDGTDSGATDGSADAAKDGALDGAIESGTDAGTCATTAPSKLCGLNPQCGCSATQTCDVTNTSTGAVSCVLAGGGPLGSYCTATSQCAKGETCGYSACRPYCTVAGTACVGTGLGECEQVYTTTGGKSVAEPNVTTCTIACDPRNPSAACGSNNCIFDTTINQPDCDKSGTVAKYDDCSAYNDCTQGLACAFSNTDEVYECESWCRIGGSDCTMFETCVDNYGATAPKSGGVRLGNCELIF